MNKGCGNCLYCGDSRLEKTGVEILCMYDSSWHSSEYSCDEWTFYSLNLNKEIRFQMAVKLKEKNDNALKNNPFILEPNLWGLGINLKKVIPWIKKILKKLIMNKSS